MDANVVDEQLNRDQRIFMEALDIIDGMETAFSNLDEIYKELGRAIALQTIDSEYVKTIDEIRYGVLHVMSLPVRAVVSVSESPDLERYFENKHLVEAGYYEQRLRQHRRIPQNIRIF